MCWKLYVAGLALLLTTLSGCKQPVMLTANPESNYSELRPPEIENNPEAGQHPLIEPTGAPATVLDPERKIRNISLAECIAMALENGQFGTSNLAFANFANANGLQTLFDQSVSFTGQGITGSDYIRAFRLDPAITGSGIELALSRFDAVWSSSAAWNNNNTPIGTSQLTFQSGGVNSPINVNDTSTSTVNTGIFKPLPTGGVAGITFNNTYTYTNLPARVNPAYQPVLQFQFEQPLLQGFGVEINQLRSAHPGSILNPGLFNVVPSAEGILITRVRFDQNRTEFERLVNFMVLNVENAYWNLYWQYYYLYAQEQGLRQAFEAWRIVKAKYDAGRLATPDLASARFQYEQFRATRLQVMADLQEFERKLRGLIGLRVEDGFRLVPSDEPTMTPFQPDWATALEEALNRVPDLILCRQEIKVAQMNVISLKNQLLPDLRFTATYDVNALGTRLDGSGSDNAFRELGADRFNDFSLGLRLNVPIGFRAAQSNYRIAQLRLARSYEFLKNTEWKVERTLALAYRQVVSSYELIKIRRAGREASTESLKARYQQYLASIEKATIDQVLDAQRAWADSIKDEYDAIRQYNQAIAFFEAAKGTALYRNNVIISEGPLPAAASRRGFEHEEERKHALPLRERSEPVHPVPLDQIPPPVTPTLAVMETPDQAGSLLNLWDKHPPMVRDVSPLPSVASIQKANSPSGNGGTPGNPLTPVSYQVPTNNLSGGISTSSATPVGPTGSSAGGPSSTLASPVKPAESQAVPDLSPTTSGLTGKVGTTPTTLVVATDPILTPPPVTISLPKP